MSEDPDVTVALLEAGADDALHAMYDFPIAAYSHQKGFSDWQDLTVPQQWGCKGMSNQVYMTEKCYISKNLR